MPRKKLDKIFDNTYHEAEHEQETLSFKVDPAFQNDDDVDIDRILHSKILYDAIHAIVLTSKFKKFNEVNELGKGPKLNKVQINEVYAFILEHLTVTYRKIEVFSLVCDYFDIYPKKFYNSLSNKYKDELMLELDAATDFMKKKNIKKLF